MRKGWGWEEMADKVIGIGFTTSDEGLRGIGVMGWIEMEVKG